MTVDTRAGRPVHRVRLPRDTTGAQLAVVVHEIAAALVRGDDVVVDDTDVADRGRGLAFALRRLRRVARGRGLELLVESSVERELTGGFVE